MPEPVLDFGVVGREIRGLVARRRELLLFLGSLFAGMGIYLQNILEGKLPKALSRLESNAFFTYSMVLTIPSIIVALRLAKLHGGMIINGIFYSKLLAAELRPHIKPERAGRLNLAGVSTHCFLLTALIASLGSALLALSLGHSLAFAASAGFGAFAVLALMFLRFHSQARRFALAHIKSARVERVDKEDLEDHVAESLRDVNHDMLNVVSFVGLILFSIFQALSSLGGINPKTTEFSKDTIERQGPFVLSLLLGATCSLAAVMYLRLLVAQGKFSLELDSTDRPFRVFRLTDALLGYSILAFFLGVAAHLIVFPWLEGVKEATELLWRFDCSVVAAALAAYALTIAVAAKRTHAALPGMSGQAAAGK